MEIIYGVLQQNKKCNIKCTTIITFPLNSWEVSCAEWILAHYKYLWVLSSYELFYEY